MPTYEYRCPKGHEFEKFFPSMNSRGRLKCPKCGLPAERLISGGAGLHFKGAGFYATDYPKAGSKPSDSESKSESKAESKSDTKSESKSESKADSKTEKASEKPKTSKPKDK